MIHSQKSHRKIWIKKGTQNSQSNHYSNFWTQIDICVPMFKAALLTIVRRWNVIDRWMNKQKCGLYKILLLDCHNFLN